jgi:hypothetical protein
MSTYFNQLDYANYVIGEHERDAQRAYQVRLARGNRPTLARAVIGRLAVVVGTMLVSVGQRVAMERVPEPAAPAGTVTPA